MMLTAWLADVATPGLARDNAQGQITQPLTLDANGHFDVGGTLAPVTGAPRPTPPLPIPARFSGTTDGKTMTLTITPAPLGAPASGVYMLTYGAPTVTTIGACPG